MKTTHIPLFRRRPLSLLLAVLAAAPLGAYAADAADTADAQAESEKTVELQSITVTGKRASAWESPQGVVATRSATATKTDTKIAHTPASVSVVTQDQMHDQGVQTVAQALRYTPGTFAESRTSIRYDSIFLRGFGGFGGNANYVQYFDGQRIPAGQGYLRTSIDPYLLERIDIVRGANSVQYGQINPGGLVNQIGKRAHFVPKREISVQAGNDHQRFVGVDLNQPISDSLAIRLTALHRGSRSKTGLDAERYAVAPSVTWRIGPKTELTAYAQWQNDPTGGDYNAVPAYGRLVANPFGNVPDNAYMGERSFERFKRNTALGGYRFSHTWNDHVSIQHNFMYTRGRSSFRNTSLAQYVRGTAWSRQATSSDEDMSGINIDAQVRFRFHTGPVQHILNVGTDYQKTRAGRLLGTRRGAGVPNVNTANPMPSVIVDPLWQSASTRRQTQWGAYVQDQIEAGGWLGQVGVRHDRVHTNDETDTYAGRRTTHSTYNQRNHKTSYQAGVMYRFANGLSPYFSYATSFEPVATTNQYGDRSPFRPTTARQWEVGLKYQPERIRALFSAAAFELTRNNVLTKDVRVGAHPNAQIQTGRVRVRGLELEARSEWTEHFRTIAALTWLKPEVTKSNIREELGKRPAGTPAFMGSLWAQYGLLNEKLKLSAGIRHVGSSYADVANTFKTPSATLIDLGAQYDLSHISPKLTGAQATLNVHNLADKKYYGGCFSRGTTGTAQTTQCYPAARRSIVMGFDYRW